MKPSSDPPLFGGLMTALVTPYRGDAIDFDALAELATGRSTRAYRGLSPAAPRARRRPCLTRNGRR